MSWKSQVAGCVGFGVAVGFASVNCATPTQIVVEVYSDACGGADRSPRVNSTNIYVGSLSDIDTRPPSAVRDACETPTGIGSLVVYPSGGRDDEVAIKVVAGIDSSPNLCFAPGHAGCIAQTRVMRFIPHVSQRMVVKLALACLNRTCPAGTTCDDGVCKAAADVLADGTTRDDSPTLEAGVTAPSPDAGVDAAADKCAGCRGTCANGLCTVECTKGTCAPGVELCAPDLPCVIKCTGSDTCRDARCTTSSSCRVECLAERSCASVTCKADTCDVRCKANRACEASNGAVSLVATTRGTLTCEGDGACGTASCSAPSCLLTCTSSGGPKRSCPTDGMCTGGCVNWPPSP